MADPTRIIPTKTSPSQSWVEWHKAMKNRYGKKQANILFVKAWELRGGAGTSASTNELRTYMADNDVVLDTSTMESITDATLTGFDSIGDLFTIGKYAVITVGVIVVGGLGLLVYNIAKQPFKAVGSVSNLTPIGKATKALK